MKSIDEWEAILKANIPTETKPTIQKDLVREASQLGLDPGEWPRELVVEGATFRLVRTQKDPDGGIVAVIYGEAADDPESGNFKSFGGRKLTVFND